MKKILFLAVSTMTLCLAREASAAPLGLEGFSGLVIAIFLGYCAIIVIAQLVAALVGLRGILNDLLAKKPVSQKVPLR